MKIPTGRQRSGVAHARHWYARVNAFILCVAASLFCAVRVAEVQDDDVIIGSWRLPDVCVRQRIARQPCFGCGLTRSVVLAASGNVTRAHGLHPAGVVLLALLVLQMVARAMLLIARPRRLAVPVIDAIASPLAAVAAAYAPLLW